MDELAVFMLVCGFPVATLAWFAVLAVSISRSNKARQRITALEDELSLLRGQQRHNAQRVHALEQWASGLPADAEPDTDAAAAAETTSPAAPATEPVETKAEAWARTTQPGYDPQRAPSEPPVPAAETAPEPDPAVVEPAETTAPATDPSAPAPSAPMDEAAPEAAAAPPPAGTPPTPTAPETAPLPDIPPRRSAGLEEWLGVKGIAALAGITLAVAGAYLFHWSIERGVITPPVRVIIGLLAGLGCVVVSERFIRKRHDFLANFVAGAGISILYFASWASSGLYDLIPRPAAFALMAAVTVACCALSIFRASPAIAVLGWLGGFATPIALSTGEDRPIALFTYILLLDGALLFTARKTRWAALALLSLLGTALYQLGWFFARMEGRTWMGVGLVALFFALFAITARASRQERAEDESENESLLWRLTRAAGCGVPFLLALAFFRPGSEGLDLGAAGAMLGLVTIGTAVVARVDRARWLQVGAAFGGAGLLIVHLLATQGLGLSPLFLGVALALLAIHHLAAEFEHYRPVPGDDVQSLTPAHAVIAFSALLSFAPLIAVEHAPLWIAALVLGVAGVSAVRVGRTRGGAIAPIVTSVAALLSFGFMHGLRALATSGPSEASWLAVGVLLALIPHAGSFGSRTPARDSANHAAAIAGVLLAWGLAFLPKAVPTPPLLMLAGALACCALVGMAIARSGNGAYWLALIPALGVRATVWADASFAEAPHALIVSLLIAAIAGPGIALLGRRATGSLWTFRGAALALPALFPAVFQSWRGAFGASSDGVPALLLGGLGVALIAVAKRRASDQHRVSAMAWAAGIAIAAVTLALPLQVENEWVTIGWALQGLALIALFRRIDHAGLKYAGLALFGVVGIRLLLNPAVVDYHPVSTLPLLNWIAYTYLVPAAAAIGGYFLLAPIELERRREFERSIMPNKALQSGALAVLAIALGFVWVNLTIFDAFAPDGPLRIDLDRHAARDLTLSLAWAIYGATLLGIGMWRKNTALRALSLGLVLLTVGKVFLYDLGNLEDLYRVASLVGLAFSLIIISLAYRRFVFPPAPAAAGPTEGDPQ